MRGRNEDIKKAKGEIPNWLVAEQLSIHENTFYRWMRVEMSEEKRKVVLQAIKEIQSDYKKGV